MQAVEKFICYGPKECLFLIGKKYPQITQNKQIYYQDDVCTQLLDDNLDNVINFVFCIIFCISLFIVTN